MAVEDLRGQETTLPVTNVGDRITPFLLTGTMKPHAPMARLNNKLIVNHITTDLQGKTTIGAFLKVSMD